MRAPQRIAFALEEVLGHATHAANLRGALAAHPEIEAQFCAIGGAPLSTLHGLSRRIPPASNSYALGASLDAWFGMRALIKKRAAAPDVLFFHTQQLALLALPLLRKTPGVLSLDAAPYSSYYYAPTDSPRARDRKQKHFRRLFEEARHLVAWSQWAADDLLDDYDIPAEKISVISPGVDTQRFCPQPIKADGVTRILFVGGDFRRKGGAWLRRWAAQTSAQNCELHMVTREEIPSQITDDTAPINIILHRDFKPNSQALIDLYRSCDVFALPTQFDCFPIALLEALACGLPCVVPRVGATREIVLDGQTGFVTPPKDEAAFAARLDELVIDAALRKTFSQAAREDATERFDSARSYGKLFELLCEVADAR